MPIFDAIPLQVIREAKGKADAVLLEEITGVTAKTWRKGGPESKSVVTKAKMGMRESFVRSLRNAGYSSDEIAQAYQSVDWENPGAWQSIIRMGGGLNPKFHCPQTMALAKEFDLFGARLQKLRHEKDLSGFRAQLISSEIMRYAKNWPGIAVELSAATDCALRADKWDELQDLLACVAGAGIYQLLACWDVEFFSKFFFNSSRQRGLKPVPLFSMVMPTVKSRFKQRADGTYPLQGVFVLPLGRLLDLSFCLGEYHRSGKWPMKGQVTRRQVASAGGEILLGEGATEQPLAKLRKGIRGLTIDEFGDVFQSMCGPDEEGLSVFPPLPIYLAAQIWTNMFVKMRTGRFAGVDEFTWGSEADYRHCWDLAFAEFKAKGVIFGDTPWPKYLQA